MLQANPKQSSARAPLFYAGLSIVAAVVTVALKVGAYLFTGSIGLFSDAAESGVNLVAAVGAFLALRTAARPPDEEHAYGHTKAEYFSSALESVLIIVAAIGIAVTAIGRLLEPQPRLVICGPIVKSIRGSAPLAHYLRLPPLNLNFGLL